MRGNGRKTRKAEESFFHHKEWLFLRQLKWHCKCMCRFVLMSKRTSLYETVEAYADITVGTQWIIAPRRWRVPVHPDWSGLPVAEKIDD